MHAIAVFAAALAILAEPRVAQEHPRPSGSILLAGEPVVFDAALVPHFSQNQQQQTSDATRGGLTRWAATEHGRKLLSYFIAGAYDITVIEDATSVAIGSAPQPGLATLVASNDDSRRKSYVLILNPSLFSVPKGMVPLPGEPATEVDAMAVGWAAELLHIYFYSRGISLPHHQRDDFQQEWLAIAAELGFPAMKHDDSDDPRPVVRPRARRVRH